MQGRLQGKRCGATHFLDEVVDPRRRGLQLPPRRRRRHGHRRGLRPHVVGAGLRRLPPLPRPRHAPPRAVARRHRAGAVRRAAPRRRAGRAVTPPGPAPPDRTARRARPRRRRRHRARVRRLPRHLRGGVDARVPRPDPRQPLQRRLLAPRDRADRAAAAPHPQRDDDGGHDGRVGQGRVQPRPARDQLPLRRRAHPVRPPHDLQDRRQGDRAPGGLQPHVHGQGRRARGQLVPHPRQPARRRVGHAGVRGRRTARDVTGDGALPRRPAGLPA